MTTSITTNTAASLALTAVAAIAQAQAAEALPRVAVEAPPPQTIVVTATRHALALAEAPAALAVVTRRDIESRGAANVLDAVRAETGLSLQGRAVGGRKVLAIRGMESRHALFLVDGQRIGASDGVIGASDFQYDWLAMDDIERIEIVRGPMSVLYGSEALGGVVNVITRQPGEAWRFGFMAEAATPDGDRGGEGWRVGARADGPLGGGLFMRAGVAASGLAPVVSPVDARISELEGRAKRDGWLALQWQPAAGQRIDVEHRAGNEDRDANARERGGARRYHVTWNDIDRAISSLGWEAAWRDGLDTQLRAYRSTIEAVNRRSAGVAVNVPQTVTESVLEGRARRPFGAHALTAGFEARDEALDDPGLPGGASTLAHRSLYAQDEWRLSRPLSLTLGLRYDTHGDYGHEWSPRAYAVWRIDDAWTVKGGASHGFKVPNLKQVVPGARAEGPNTFLGNPALKPERSDSIEFGAAYGAGALQAQAMLFDQRVQDLIEVRLVAPGATPGIGTYTYENLARARLRGLEASGSMPLGAGVTAGLSYTYLDAKNGSGGRLERRPRHSAAVRLDWQRGVWRAGVQIEHAGDQRLPAAAANTPAQRVPDLTLVGAQLGCELPQGLSVTLGVRNLTGVSLAEKSTLFTHAEAPRTWRLAMRGAW